MNTVLGALKSTIRTVAAGAFYASSMYRWRHQGKVIVLTYHRVLSRDEVCRQFVQPGMYVLDTVFAQHMTFVKDNFTVLSFQQLLDLWQNNRWSDHTRYCVITFDDGWLDNYFHAYPILKRLDIPATIFLPTDYVGSHEWFWPDQLSLLLQIVNERNAKIEHLKVIEAVLSRFLNGEGRMFVEALARQELVIDLMIERCKHLPIERTRELVTTLAAELGVSLPQDRVIVNWDEVREMSRYGISFGSHSCSHRILTTITPEDVSQELVASRQALLEQGVSYVPVFCYPNGNSDHQIQKQVQACGYEAAVGVRIGVEGRRPRNRYAINRVGIHNDVTQTIPLFSLRLLGPLPGSA
jgi:peptidoglycan/xylan/chitin deacetylase (PgdA/CDA1 family)